MSRVTFETQTVSCFKLVPVLGINSSMFTLAITRAKVRAGIRVMLEIATLGKLHSRSWRFW